MTAALVGAAAATRVVVLAVVVEGQCGRRHRMGRRAQASRWESMILSSSRSLPAPALAPGQAAAAAAVAVIRRP